MASVERREDERPREPKLLRQSEPIRAREDARPPVPDSNPSRDFI
jgi:hypothetical protein